MHSNVSSFLVLKKPGSSLTLDTHFQHDAFWTMSVTYRDSGFHFTKDFSAYLNIDDWLHYISSRIFKTQIQLMSRNGRGVRARRKGRIASLKTWPLSRVSVTRKEGSRIQSKWDCVVLAAGIIREKMHPLCSASRPRLLLAVDEESDCPQNWIHSVWVLGPHCIKRQCSCRCRESAVGNRPVNHFHFLSARSPGTSMRHNAFCSA